MSKDKSPAQGKFPSTSTSSTMVTNSPTLSASSGLDQDHIPKSEMRDRGHSEKRTPAPGDISNHRGRSEREKARQRPWPSRVKATFQKGGALRPFRLLRQDWANLPKRYLSDWTTFNQLIFASAVYVFFTNLLPGITFASDLYVLTGKNWGTIEVVFSTGLCGIIFAV
jgi:HCO3- transporter family